MPTPEHDLTLVLDDGRQIHIRRADGGDATAILGLYEDLSPQSRWTRFFQATPRLTARLRDLLTDLDHADVWLAYDGDQCVGEARLATSARTGCADLAVTVADGYQHHGLGQRLAGLATTEQRRRNGCVSMSIMAENTAAIRLARRAKVPLRFDQGVLEGDLRLGAA